MLHVVALESYQRKLIKTKYEIMSERWNQSQSIIQSLGRIIV